MSKTKKPLVVIIAGSAKDANHCRNLRRALNQLNLESVIRIASAHKTVEHAISLLKYYEKQPGPKLYITVAGRSNALSGFVDGLVLAPVIACPPLDGVHVSQDIWSSLRMPSGIAVAVILEPENAALFAAKLFSDQYPEIQESVQRQYQKQQALIEEADNVFQQELLSEVSTSFID